jgi:hypothetical protein
MIIGPFLLISIFFCLWGCHKQQEDEVFTQGGHPWYSDTDVEEEVSEITQQVTAEEEKTE